LAQARQDGQGPGIQETVQPQRDLSICVNCEADNGPADFPLVAGQPMCLKCAAVLRNRPFPAWVQMAFAVTVALALFTFYWNLRYFQGYAAGKRADRAWDEGDIDAAYEADETAAAYVPEAKAYQIDALFARGLILLREGKNAEAAKVLAESDRQLGRTPHVALDYYLAVAEGAAAFEAKDYDTFLAKSQARFALMPRDYGNAACVASAYACKYAVTGDESHKARAEEFLQKARALAGDADREALAEYEARIRHRLASRQILTVAEYYRLFPKEEKAAP
jgi:hypothetical protein